MRILGMRSQTFDRLVARLSRPAVNTISRPVEERRRRGDIRFGLAFSGGSTAAAGAGAHELILDWARVADQAGLASLWLPERHFHPLAGLSPNPSVLAAALARETERIALRAGSVVLPLHHPVRVVEEWALVDNLSGGRVGLAFAADGNARDLVLAPASNGNGHHADLRERAATIRRLWRGEAIRLRDGAGTEVDLRVYPLPARRDLPIWISAGDDPELYRLAGEMAAGVLTHLLGPTIEELAAHLGIYREALVRAGHPSSAGHVALLLPTFLDADAERAIAISRPALDRLEARTPALVGSCESVAPLVERLREIGVDEIACLVDFGVDAKQVRAGLPWIAELQRRFRVRRPAGESREVFRFPLTEAQRDLWTVAQLGEEASLAYLEAALVEIRGPLDPDLLRRSLQEVVDRHEALRSLLPPSGPGEEPLQEVLPERVLEAPLVDLSALPRERREEAAHGWAEQESRQPFDLVRGPLFRASLARRAPGVWRLGLAGHHIVVDGLSIAILLTETLAIYEAGRAGRRAALPEPLQFREYAAWLSAGGAETPDDEAYWLTELARPLPVFEPPADRPRPPLRTFRGARRRRLLAPALDSGLRQTSRQQRATLFIGLLAAWTALLHRWTGQDDVIVGGPTARRPLEGGDRLVGHCVDLVPYRSRIDGPSEPTFAEHLAAIRRIVFASHEHGGYPLARLLRRLALPHDPSRVPLVNAVFNMDPGLEIDHAAGLELIEVSPAITHVKYDVAVHVVEAGGALAVQLDYRSDLFDAATMDRLLDHFENLVGGVIADPALPLGDLPLLSEAERDQVLVEWNRTESGSPLDTPVPALFDAVAEKQPEAPAVIWSGPEGGEESLTYAELRRRAESLALHLRGMGVGPEVPVALDLERSPELVVALVAVLKAGGFYVPLDPADPAERRAFLLEDTGAAVRLKKDLKDSKDLKDANQTGASLSFGSFESLGSFPAEPAAGGQHLAYTLYTSGSTGRPKGVAVSHRAVVRLALADYIRLTPDDRVGHISNTAFDAATFEIWGALLNGASLVVLPREVVMSPATLGTEIRRRRVTAAFFTVSLFNELVREVPEALAGMRWVLAGGEAVAPDRMREALSVVEAAGTETRFLNGYGPTESTTFALTHWITAAPPGRSIPIGRPLSDTRAYIVDRLLRPVPPGSPGELCLGGEGLARGYWRRPALTAERFVPDPFGRGRLYRTGDLTRLRPDGTVEYLGRTDTQVKIRGFRVEPGEIEAALTDHPAVREAAVVAQEVAGGRRLAAFLVSADGADLGPAALHELLQGLRERLPQWMVPAAVSVLEALPRTPSGKIDRRALALQEAAQGVEAPYEPPRTRLEKLVAAAWEEVLQRERIGLRDDFFDLGGHSLLATQVISRLRVSCGVELPLRHFFARPRLADMASVIQELLGPSPPAPLPQAGEGCRLEEISRAAEPSNPLPSPACGRGAGGEGPLSFAQQRLWFLDRFAPGSPVYNVPALCRISGLLSPAVLHRALLEVARRHATLRTTFAEDADGTPRQVIAPEPRLPLPSIDLGGLPPALHQAEIDRITAAEARRPFDLETGPLARALLLRRAPDDHALFLTLHHIAADGWSLGILARELSALYTAFAAGAPSPLPDLPMQYVDFAVWQRGWLTGSMLEEQLAWWRQHLAGAPARLELPADRPRPAMVDLAGARISTDLPAELPASVQALARREGVSPFMVWLAAFATLLARWTGQDDLVIGTPVANRNRVETEDLIGFFVNTLPLRIRLAGRPPFREILARVRDATLGGFTHQDVPLEKLVEELHPERDPSRNPLVEVLFSLLFSPPPTGGEVRLGEWRFVAPDTAKFDLTLELEVEKSTMDWEYRTSLFDPSTLHRLGHGFITLLAGAVAAPDTEIAGLPLLSASELHQILVEWNQTESGAPLDTPLHVLFDAVAGRAPAAPALIWSGPEGEEKSLTYGELRQRAEDLARELRGLGVGPEVPVALELERSPELIVAMLAVLKAGGFYVPLDPADPAERRAFILEDTGAAMRVKKDLKDLKDPKDTDQFLSFESFGSLESFPGEAPSGGELLAYAIYTSGSTGRPKGVMVSHRSVVRLALADYVRLAPDDRVGHVSHTAFDVATFDIWAPLLQGASVVVIPREVIAAPAALAAEIQRRRITAAFFTVSLFNELVREAPEALLGMRQILAGGEAVSPDAMRAALAARADSPGSVARFLNGYGPTECTVFALTHRITAAPPGRSIPIGRPISDTSAHVVDRQLRPVPIGSPGELCLGGEGVARGYLRRPALTADRFVPDPFARAGRGGGRLYRTGDLARFLPDGTVEYLGRTDAQVKIRGFRVEPGEIEAALADHPAVREAAVVPQETGGGKRLAAFLVAQEGADLGPSALQELVSWLRERLPHWMVPAATTVVETLPKTSSGKIDRGVLAVRDVAAPEAPFEAPRTPVEQLVAAAWAEVLQHERIGRHDDFFALGGHSLIASQVISRLRVSCGVELPLRRLFARPQLAELAAAVEEILEPSPPAPLPRAGEGSRLGDPQESRASSANPYPSPARGPQEWDQPAGGEGLPLSFSQQRLWFLDRFSPGSAVYNIPALGRVAGPLDVDVLRRALREVARRHEVLRTTFAEAPSGMPRQVIAPEPCLPLPLIDLGALPAARRSAEEARLTTVDANRPFDLETGPLARVLLLRSAPDSHALFFNLHHIAADGWSLGLLARELSVLYTAFAAGLPSPLADLPVQYADFAVWQRQWLSGPVLGEQLAWWRDHLAGVPAQLDLPTDRPRPATVDQEGSHVTAALPADLVAEAQSLALAERATPFMVWLAAFATLLARWADQDDLVIGTPVANRNRIETEGLIGFFVNTLPLRIRLDGRPSFRELLERVREASLGGLSHQDIPFEKLIEELHPERDPSRHPLVEAVFSLLFVPPPPDLGLALGSWQFVAHSTSKFDLALELDSEERLLRCEHRTSLFDEPTIHRLLRGFVTLLAGAVAAPDADIAGLPLLGGAELHQILVEWNRQESGAPLDTPVHVLFDAMAERQPDAPAVIWSGPEGEESLAYGELRRRADGFADRLRTLGVGPEVPVALDLERSPELVVAMLAVLKAGGFYVPLDPSDPEERRAFILDDTGAAVRVYKDLKDVKDPKDFHQNQELLSFESLGSFKSFPESPSGEHLAYTLYTSGSTGSPKGVAVPHRAVVRLALADYVRLTPDDRVGHLSNTAFDAATFEIWGALLNGAALVVIPREVVVSPAALGEEIRRRGVTAAFFTVSLFNELVREAPEALVGMRQALAGGEAVAPDRMREALAAVAAAGTETRFLNGYGPTESTTFALTHRITAAPPGRSIPIGRPISDTRAHVVDRLFQPVPVGTPGELCLGGEGLARGYWRRPALTAERFVPDPFAQSGGGRLYRTGDLARFLPDGTVEYLGRTDAQVKIRGFRVEPGEIEAALEAHPAVREAAVVAQEIDSQKTASGRRLAAFLVAEEGADLGPAALHELLAGLRERLPQWMMPAAVSVLEALPRTPSGKLDRRALSLQTSAQGVEAPFEPPQSPLEELVAASWMEVLQRERIGRHDDFFALGGHSLLATQVISRLRTSFGIELPLRRFFAQPKLADLAALVEEALGAGAIQAPPIVPLSPEEREAELPLSFAQQRLWFLDRLAPGSPVYNVPALCRISGRLSVPDLERALREIVRRHEILRTTFVPGSSGTPRQEIALAPDLPLPVVDLGDHPVEAERIALAEAARPFDLETGPLVRALLLRTAADDHTLVLNLHHIVADGWSIHLLMRELSAPSPLPDLPVQYADFAVWQRRWLAGPVLDEQLAWWRRHLAGAPAQLDLPADHPRPATLDQTGRTASEDLPAELTAGVEALSRREGATPFMVWLAAIATLLSRWTGQDDLVIGTPVANRNRVETEGLIGFFVNTLPLRASLAGGPSFRDLLAQVREAALGAFTHQDVPLEKLVEELHLERDPARNPLVEVLFSLQIAAPPALDTHSRPVEIGRPRFVPTGTAKFDLSFELGAEQGVIHCEHRIALFDLSTIHRLLQGFATLLAGALEAPEAEIGDLPLLDTAERHQILVEWNRMASGAPLDTPVHVLFDAVAERQPQAPAVLWSGPDGAEESLTYGELRQQADRLALELSDLGVGPEVPVALDLERSPELIVALLAVLKAGGFYVPLDPADPEERRAFILEDTGAAVRVALTPGPSPASGRGERVSWRKSLELQALANLHPTPARGRGAGGEGLLAYTLYTSGSTGKPKGVAVPHRAVVRLALADYVRLTPDDRVGHLSNTAFDAATFEIWGALLNGAALVVIPRETVVSPAALGAEIRRRGVTTGFFTVSLFNEMVREAPEALVGMPRVLAGGEAVTPDRMREALAAVAAAGSETRFLNGYGPTESTTFAVTHRIAAAPPGRSIPIGRPISDTRAFVVDRLLRPVPIGSPGELCLGGAGLARGYWRRPALTAERFVPDPFTEDGGGERLYRTGDLARFLPDGTIEYLGRTDAQVKIRGFRIEPGEIEAALADHPAVREAAVVAQEAGGGKRLAAFLVAEDGADLGPAALHELLRGLRERLPQWMVPAAVSVLEALPRTPSGKLDRRTLAFQDVAQGAPEAPFEAPRTPVEKMVAATWAEVLQRERIGLGDDFFALGGHSLLATQVISRLRASCGVELPLRRFFAQPKLADLAAAVEEALGVDASQAPPIVPVQREEMIELPLSFAQQRLWFLDRLAPGSPVYNIPALCRIAGPLSISHLGQALREVARRHEVLRTTFVPGGSGTPRQAVSSATGLPLPIIDLGDHPAEAERLASAEAARPFDLAAGPLIRALLLRIAVDDHTLVLNLHHIVADGWSIGLLMRELSAVYTAFAAGAPSPLPDLPVQYADFAVWQRRWLAGPVLDEQLAWWRRHLAGAPAHLDLPTDRPRPALLDLAGAHAAEELPAELIAGAQTLARREGATPFMIWLAAVAALLSRWTGQDDLVIGTPVANRNRAETEGLIGFFVNTLPLRVGFAGNPSFREILARVRETALGAFTHQDVPLERLVEELHLERDPSRSPLVEVLFSLPLAPSPDAVSREGGESRLGSWRFITTGTAKFDLTFEPGTEAGAIGCEHRISLFDRSTIHRLLQGFVTLLTGALAAPETEIADLPLLNAAQLQQILVEWNQTASSAPLNTPLHVLFDAVAENQPGAPAVIWSNPAGEEESLTYGELRQRADRLAGTLRGLGVGPEVAVALELERSPELVVAMLATLKAGGFYVPLDPADPEERRAFVLEDTGAVVRIKKDLRDLKDPRDPKDTLSLESFGSLGSFKSFEHSATGQSLAYTIYTSGSTGRPKGVMVAHRSVVRLALADYIRLAPDDRVGHVSHTAFDVATFDMWAPLLQGAALVVIPREILLEPAVLGDEIWRRGVTAAFFTVSLFNELVRQAPEALTGMRWVLAGGEAVSPDAMRAALAAQAAAGSDTRFLNGYGPTECTVFALTHRITAAPFSRSIPIGRPISDTSAYVLDRLLRPVPVGTPGELCLGGEGVARGYLRQPELTADRFVPDPFPREGSGERLYRTGDLARFLPDGTVEYLGRTDAQVKIRGFRVEPGEIEAALAEHPAVREAAVVPQEAAGGKRLAAFLVAEEGADLGPAALHEVLQGLRERLPQWMVPAAVSVLETLPKTPSGKIDRRALALQDVAQGATGAPFEAPRTPVELQVAATWAEVLQRERIGLHDDFFALGGHSLLATQVISRLRASLGIELPLHRLFARPRLLDLAAEIEEALKPSTPAPLPQVGEGCGLEGFLIPGSSLANLHPSPARGRGAGVEGFPLSFAQQRLWFVAELAPESPTLNIPAPFELAGPLNVAALEDALTEVVRRHEALRATFVRRDGALRQITAPAAPVAIPRIDLSALPPEIRTAEAARLAREIGKLPFNLATGPLWRAVLLRLGPETHRFVPVLHHIVFDGWSVDILERELAVLYEASSAGRPSPLPPLPLQYPDFAVWQRQRLTDEVLAPSLDWWRQRLAGLRPVELPTDLPRPLRRSGRGTYRTRPLPAEVAAAVHSLAQSETATLYMVLLAAFFALLQKATGQTDLAVGSPVAGRDRIEHEGLIGAFINSLVLRVDLGGDPSFRELLRRVREAALAAFSHQEVPFERLVEELEPRRSSGPSDTSPLFQVMFALLHEQAGPQQTGFGGLAMTRLAEHNDTAQFDLTLYMQESGSALEAILEYATDLFTAATVDWMLARFEDLLAAATADPDRRLSDLPPAQWLAFQAAGRKEAPAEPESRRQALQESVEERRSRLSEEAKALLARRLRGRSS